MFAPFHTNLTVLYRYDTSERPFSATTECKFPRRFAVSIQGAQISSPPSPTFSFLPSVRRASFLLPLPPEVLPIQVILGIALIWGSVSTPMELKAINSTQPSHYQARIQLQECLTGEGMSKHNILITRRSVWVDNSA